MAEAAAQFQKGLDQLALLPETHQRQQQELEFWSALGAALRFVKGQATPEMGHAFARARELWEQLGRPSQFLHIPYGQSFYHMYRGEFDVAQRLDEDLLWLSRERGDTSGLVLGHAAARCPAPGSAPARPAHWREWLGEDAEGNPVPAEAAGSPVGAGYDSPPSSISNLAEIGVPCASLALSPPCKVAVAFFIAAANADELPSSARALAPTALERPIVATSTMTGTALDVIVSLLTRDMVPRSLVRVL